MGWMAYSRFGIVLGVADVEDPLLVLQGAPVGGEPRRQKVAQIVRGQPAITKPFGITPVFSTSSSWSNHPYFFLIFLENSGVLF